VRQRADGGVERLVSGVWVATRRPRRFEDRSIWKPLGEDELQRHARQFFIDDFGSERMGWRGHLRDRFKRSSCWRWIVPPPIGGSVSYPYSEAVNEYRDVNTKDFSEAEGDDLLRLTEEALLGYEEQGARGAGLEQRASFLLGAAGLTTSLVLANAGLLLGAGELRAPWLNLSAGALALATLCAVAAGWRAMQAAMLPFARSVPNSVAELSRRGQLSGDDLNRAYAGSLLSSQSREWSIANWKIARLAAAQRWFLATILGVVALIGFVLANAVTDGEVSEAHASVSEVAVLGEDHRHAGGVAGLDHLGVALGAARLDDGVGARLDRQLGSVGEGEEGVGGEGGAG
jgi:hypothetical protein